MTVSKFIKVLVERGFIHQATDLNGLDKLCYSQSIAAYIGFDCTADSLHVGSLTQIMMLRHLQKTGHKPIVLMGGGTTKVGDPSGKDSARPLLTINDINLNMESIKSIFEKYLVFGKNPSDAVMVDNSIWLDKLELISFLRDYGKHFSINRLLSMESVKQRLEREQPLSFLEFNYAILQAYDFLELNRKYNCFLQMGGSDQWGNIVSGIDLTRRIQSKEVFGLTSPLITTASGSKMGKTANGAIWLNEDKLSTWDFWQFWRNTEDKDVIRFLKLFTEVPISQIQEIQKLKGAQINDAKILLANEVTKLCHGTEAAIKAHNSAKDTFEKGLNCLAKRGRIVSYGISSGKIDPIDINKLRPLSASIATGGLLEYTKNIDEYQKNADDLFDLVHESKINIQIHKEYNFDEIQKAHIELEQRKSVGKIIINLR